MPNDVPLSWFEPPNGQAPHEVHCSRSRERSLATLAPHIWLVDDVLSPKFKEASDGATTMTPREFFETAAQFQRMLGLNLSGERAEDTRDCTEFYEATFAEHREKSGEK